MAKILLGSGYLTWDAVERRTDRYGAVRSVVSTHPGDLHRKIKHQTLRDGDVVVFGTGELFVDRKGRPDTEPSATELEDAKSMERLMKMFAATGAKVIQMGSQTTEEPYDAVGVKPEDGRSADWMNPQSFYNCHMSWVDLFFEESE